MKDLASEKWVHLFGRGAEIQKIAGGWRLAFPDDGSIHYAATLERHKHIGSTALVIDYKLAKSANARFRALDRKNNEGLEPCFRPMLAWSLDGVKDNDRWWNNDVVFCADARSGTKRWELDPAQWTNVQGKPADTNATTLKGFQKCRRRSVVGLTFGGGWNAGHGVSLIRGSASLTVYRCVFTT